MVGASGRCDPRRDPLRTVSSKEVFKLHPMPSHVDLSRTGQVEDVRWWLLKRRTPAAKLVRIDGGGFYRRNAIPRGQSNLVHTRTESGFKSVHQVLYEVSKHPVESTK